MLLVEEILLEAKDAAEAEVDLPSCDCRLNMAEGRSGP